MAGGRGGSATKAHDDDPEREPKAAAHMNLLA